jgi:serine/threonine-protein kinase
LIRRCLAKNPEDRLPHIGVARLELKEGDELSPSSRRFPGVPPWVALAAAVAVFFVGFVLARRDPAATPGVVRIETTLVGDQELTISGQYPDLAITPGGERLIVSQDGQTLLVRSLDDVRSTSLDARGSGPFVSPDGRWVGFYDSTGQALKRVPLAGGTPVNIAAVTSDVYGASWGPDDTIVFGTRSTESGLSRVRASGGDPELLTRPDRAAGELSHVWPDVLPGGRAVLFTILRQTLEQSEIAVLDLSTREYRAVIRGGTYPVYATSGHIVFSGGGTLRAIAFDVQRLETIGEPISVGSEVLTKASGAADFTVSQDGLLAYVRGVEVQRGTAPRTMVWVDQSGREIPIDAPRRPYAIPRLSPDGRRVAFQDSSNDFDLWTYDFSRRAFERITFDPGQDTDVVWSPDGRRIAYYANDRADGPGIFLRASDGSGDDERLTTGAHRPQSWSSDGLRLVFSDFGTMASLTSAQGSVILGASRSNRDVGLVELTGARTPRPLFVTPTGEDASRISPDGRWIAYESRESGTDDVFLRAFPDAASGRWQISRAGGRDPVWSRDSRALFYRQGNAIMVVRVNGSPANWGAAEMLFEGAYYFADGPTHFDVAPDGRFLMLKGEDPAEVNRPRLVMVVNWDQELQRMVPTR